MNKGRPPPEPLIPGYAGHADVAARRLSDQQVRAWVGEILAGVADRMPIGGLQDRFDAVLMRCEFGDQPLILALENERLSAPEAAARVEAADRELIEAAQRGRTIGLEELPALLDALQRAFDGRRAAIIQKSSG